MSNRNSDSLFVLVKSLGKSEKRNFKLFAKRNSSKEELKIIKLFNALDKMKNYDESQLFKKSKGIAKAQLSNIKAQLYKQLLASLRLIRNEANIDMQLHVQMDSARLLYNRGLYLQSLKLLERIKETAKYYHQLTYLQQVLFFEKKIEALFITRSMGHRAEELSAQSREVNMRLSLVSDLSDLSLQLYSWYIGHGHARNRADLEMLDVKFEKKLPARVTGFYENIYLHQCQCWLSFIRQDFRNYYRHSKNWVDCFRQHPQMVGVETALYIKAMHNLLTAEFYMLDAARLKKSVEAMENICAEEVVEENENNRILAHVYLYTARINLCFLEGTFQRGIKLVPFLEEMLKKYGIYLDNHRVLIFYYKIGCLYFGSGNNAKCIDYLNRIINQRSGLRNDLQCYAKLLHLIAHYELGNFELLEYLTKSVYRYMAKMENLSGVEEAIFGFLRSSLSKGVQPAREEFAGLLSELRLMQDDPLETRAFVYLDVISWLESKISGVRVQDVIRKKYLERNREAERVQKNHHIGS